jgi:transposase
MKKLRRNHAAAFKARIALEALRGEKTVAEISSHHQVHPTQVTSWKSQLLENAAAIFGSDAVAADGRERIRELHAKIGEIIVERDFLADALGKFPGPSGKR